MLYLITGAPRVGKSVIARDVADRLGLPVVSTDDLRERIAMQLSLNELRDTFKLSGFSAEAAENVMTPADRVEAQYHDASVLHDGLDGEVERLIGEGGGIIEGVHLLPLFVSDWSAAYGAWQLSVIVVGSTDLSLVERRLAQSEVPSDWLMHADGAVRRQVAEFVVAMSERLRKEAEVFGFQYIERTDDFSADVESAAVSLLLRK